MAQQQGYFGRPAQGQAPMPMYGGEPSVPVQMALGGRGGMGGGAARIQPMSIGMMGQMALSRVGVICTWQRNDDADPRLTSTHIILPHRSMKGGYNYYPGVLNLTRPPWFADFISEEDWKNTLMRFNKMVYDWWKPGDYARTASLFFGSLMIFPLFCFFAFDETGDCCFRNRKKLQLMVAAEPICKELSATTPFEWSLEWRQEMFERADAVQNDLKTLELRVRLKEPLGPDAMTMNRPVAGAPDMMSGLANLFQAQQQMQQQFQPQMPMQFQQQMQQQFQQQEQIPISQPQQHIPIVEAIAIPVSAHNVDETPLKMNV